MKFGVVSYERKALRINGNTIEGFQNIGDWIQMIAMENLFREWGIHDYVRISRNDARTYNGEYVFVPWNGYNTLIDKMEYKTSTFPLSNRIIPIFVSFHFHDSYIPKDMETQLRLYAPIGCRDEETMINMRNHGIPSYLSGCVTALLPIRKIDEKKQNKILFVDTPLGIEEFVPNDIKERAEYHKNVYHIKRNDGELFMTREESEQVYEYAKKTLEYWRDNAQLVVTSRLHVASPCLAMGIPVILVANQFDGRFSWIDKYLKLYPKNKWNEIEWYPKSVVYEEKKIWIKDVIKRRIMQAYKHNKDIYDLSEFYERRKREVYYSEIIKCLKMLNLQKEKEHSYAIWGVKDSCLKFTNNMRIMYPNWKLKKVYDLNVEGEFEGITIETPDNISGEFDLVYFVLAKKPIEEAKKKLNELGKMCIIIDFENSIVEKLLYNAL